MFGKASCEKYRRQNMLEKIITNNEEFNLDYVFFKIKLSALV